MGKAVKPPDKKKEKNRKIESHQFRVAQYYSRRKRTQYRTTDYNSDTVTVNIEKNKAKSINFDI